jgi:hypothetical protein
MIGRRTAVGLSLLCALAFCAFAAQSALAAKAKNTTAVTCVKGGGAKDFKDAHCDEKVTPETGQFGHVAFSLNATTEVEVNNSETKNNTTEPESAILKGTLAGAEAEVTCKTATSEGAAKASWIENKEHSAAKEHTFLGTVAVRFKECQVKKPAKCTVKEPIEVKSVIEGVEGLTFGANKEAMGVEFKPDGEGESVPFAELTFEGAECALKGLTFQVLGTAIGTGTPIPTKENKHSGATTVFEAGNEMQKLTLGGKPATFTGKFTTRMTKKENPIALTTTT